MVVAACMYEVLALLDPCPLPTLSELVKRRPAFGVLLLGLLGHHWYLEQEPAVILEPVIPGT